MRGSSGRQALAGGVEVHRWHCGRKPASGQGGGGGGGGGIVGSARGQSEASGEGQQGTAVP